MIIIYDVLVIILLFFTFGYSHSLLASDRVKEYLKHKLGRFFPFYRIVYNLVSLISFYFIIVLSPKPDIVIYDLNPPFDIIIYLFQLLSLAGLLWSLRYMNLKQLLGTEQMFSFFKGENNQENINTGLILEGPYKLSRHPVYLFSVLFVGLRPQMSLFYFVSFVCLTLYFYIGSFYEEKKLINTFGKVYVDYIERVPRIFPSLRIFKVIKNINQV